MNPRFKKFILHPSYIILSCVALCAAQPPSWWTDRGVIDTNATPNDFAAVTQGQVKNIATNAYLEMEDVLPQFGGAGTAVSNLVFSFTDQGNYQPANLGQLKAVAAPFYDRLIAIGYSTNYPWAGSTNAPNDFAMANIGQLKNLFSFDVYAIYDSLVPVVSILRRDPARL